MNPVSFRNSAEEYTTGIQKSFNNIVKIRNSSTGEVNYKLLVDNIISIVEPMIKLNALILNEDVKDLDKESIRASIEGLIRANTKLQNTALKGIKTLSDYSKESSKDYKELVERCRTLESTVENLTTLIQSVYKLLEEVAEENSSDNEETIKAVKQLVELNSGNKELIAKSHNILKKKIECLEGKYIVVDEQLLDRLAQSYSKDKKFQAQTDKLKNKEGDYKIAQKVDWSDIERARSSIAQELSVNVQAVSEKDIAKRLGVSYNAIKYRVSQMIKELSLKGYSDKDIATQLHISVDRVKKYR